MAMSLNKAQLIGNLTRDPEVRQTPSGRTVTSFSVATNYSWKDQNGQKQERAEFHNIVAWGKLAEICGQYLTKGKKVYIEGRLQTRDWEGDDGVKRYKTEIVADNMIMLSYDDARPQRSLKQEESKTEPDTTNVEAPSEEEVTIDDLPF